MTSETGGRDAAAYIARALEQAGDPVGVTGADALLPIRKVGVIGAGTMGGGIAMNFASVGIPVTVVDTKQEALDRGLGVVRRNYENSAKKGRFNQEEAEARIGRISGALRLEDLADCDLIIEAVFEDMGLKKDIFARLDVIAAPHAVLASNTSALDLNEIAAVTSRPENVIGLHFFSPANVMKLLEIVRGDKTSDVVIATSMKLAQTIQKVAVLVGVCPGFVGNRMLFPRQAQAMRLIYSGALPWDVDRVLNAFGFKMGPFQMADLAGLDIGWTKGAKTYDPIRDALCELDRRGQKTSAGYYDYDENRKPIPSPVSEKIILEEAARLKVERRSYSDADILQALIYPMINEGAKILEEGIAGRASDIDVVWLYGYGWPADKGGPMFYADTVGLDKVVKALATMAQAEPRLQPAALLRRLAAEGGFIADYASA